MYTFRVDKYGELISACFDIVYFIVKIYAIKLVL